jgi:hypothetical protein
MNRRALLHSKIRRSVGYIGLERFLLSEELVHPYSVEALEVSRW